jgi:hypothetical protein
MLEHDSDLSVEPGEPALSVRDRFQRRPVAQVALAIAVSLLIVFFAVFRLALATNHSDGKNPLPTSAERLTGSRASSIEGLPAPTQAHLDGSDRHSAEYTLPASVNQVKSWYLAHLQPGRSWRDWSWVGANSPGCAGQDQGDAVFWQWESGGSTLALAVYPSLVDRPFGAVTIDVYHQTPFCTSTL